METNKAITIETIIKAPVETVWKTWITPADIKKWNTASPDWHTTKSENDLREGGKFSSRMEAKDGSMGFDFGGTYTKVKEYKHIAFTLDDGRKVTVDFQEKNGSVHITETFEPESQNPIEMQRGGWQGILDNFKKYVESK